MTPRAQTKRTRGTQRRCAAALAVALLLPAAATRAEESACPETGGNASNLIVSLTTPLGELCVELFQDGAPGHVENFLYYLDAGEIDDTFFHRSVPGFIIQGGGFRAVDGEHETVPAREGIVVENEPCDPDLFTNDLPAVPICGTRGNERGTLAMAKRGSDPDSGTTNWFINLADNRANLDNQNGGFTVFGQVLEEGMAVVDDIAALDAAPLTQLFWRHSAVDYAFTASAGQSTLPLLVTPPLDVSSFGCFEAESLTLAVEPAPNFRTPRADPFDPTDYYRMSGACGEPVAPEAFEMTAAGDGCTYGSVLTLAVELFPEGIFPAVDSNEAFSYFGFSCEAAEEAIAQRSGWEEDFNARFDAELITIENAVRVPEPSFPFLALTALTTLAGLRRLRIVRKK